MQIPFFFKPLAVVSGLLALSMFRPQTITEAPPKTVKLNDENIMAVLYQQQSAEYRALCYQAYNVAKWRLNEKIAYRPAGSKPAAVVVDIDETVLDNSPYNAKMIRKDQPFSLETWSTWVNLHAAAAVPGAVEFLKFADSKSVAVFFISNRSQAEKQGTLDNLRSLGFPQVDYKKVLLKEETSNKETRRKEVSLYYDIVMLCGDNMNDFAEMFEKQPIYHRNQLTDSVATLFGDKFIALPNPMYGDWENALYSYQRLDDNAKDSVRRRALKIY